MKCSTLQMITVLCLLVAEFMMIGTLSESPDESRNREPAAEANVWEVMSTDTPSTLQRAPVPSQNRDTRFQIQRNEPVKIFALEAEDAEQEDSKKKPLSIEDLSVEQIIENNRRYLINKHGNIPEIDVYLKLNASFYEREFEKS